MDGITSGTEKAADGNSPSNPTCSDTDFASAWCGMEAGPWDYVPSVGFSDIERYMDATGQVAANQFLCLTDNGFGNAANSWDYPLHLNLCAGRPLPSSSPPLPSSPAPFVQD